MCPELQTRATWEDQWLPSSYLSTASWQGGAGPESGEVSGNHFADSPVLFISWCIFFIQIIQLFSPGSYLKLRGFLKMPEEGASGVTVFIGPYW